MDANEMVSYIVDVKEAIINHVSSIAERFDKLGNASGHTKGYFVRNIAQSIRDFDLKPYVIKVPAGEQGLLVKLYRHKFKEVEAIVLKNYDLLNRHMLHNIKCNVPDGTLIGALGCTCIPAELLGNKEDASRVSWLERELNSSKYSVNLRQTPGVVTVTTNREGGARKRIYTDTNLRAALDTARRANGS